MNGPSTSEPSHGAVCLSSRAGLPVSASPSGDSRWDHSHVSAPIALPSFFHSRYSAPSVSRNGLASIEPPSSAWQTNGRSDPSTYGPPGAGATAAPMHCRPVAADAAV